MKYNKDLHKNINENLLIIFLYISIITKKTDICYIISSTDLTKINLVRNIVLFCIAI